MSLERTAEFIAKVGEDKELQAQLEQIDTAEELIRFAQEQGYEVTQEDWDTVSAKIEAQSEELSEDELEAVAGGGWGSFVIPAVQVGIGLLQDYLNKKK